MDNIFSILNSRLPAPKGAETPEQKPAVPAVSDMDTRDLVMAWQKKSTPEYTEELLKRMQPTMRAAITSYAGGDETGMSVKAANMTLTALKAYRPEYGAEPSTFVFHNLKKLNRISASRSNIIPESEATALNRRRLQEAIDDFVDRKNREPSDDELADITGFSKKRIARLLDYGNTVLSESSTLADESNKDTFSKSGLTDKDYYEYVYASVGPVDQKIMEWSSGMRHGKVLSNNEIAQRLHITPAAVSQRRAKLQNMIADMRSLV